MRPLRDLSIRFKLTASLVIVVSIALVMSTIAGLVEQHESAKAALETQISVLADVLGDASMTALKFSDAELGNEVLAIVKREPKVVFAQTFDADSESFAIYKASASVSENVQFSWEKDQAIFHGGFLHVFKKIGDPKEPRGAIYLRASLDELYAQSIRRIRLALLSLLICLGIAVLLGFLVQRAIARPIRELAAATEKVARQGDYSAHVYSNANDEIGVLCNGFNTMLDQIQQRDQELETHRTHLEDLVQERTSRLEAQTQQLTDSNAQLERSNQELDDFAYIVSHDLKEPLRGISRYSSFIAEDYAGKLDEAGHEKLETLQRLCLRQENLIDSLLHYSRVGRAELAIAPTDLNDVIEQVLDMMHVTLEEQRVEVRVPRHLPTVACDSVRIVEVFRNLITNAVKYNDKAEKWIEIGFQQHGESGENDGNQTGFVFYVRDNGIGIREKHQESVFRIFKRLHARDKYGGGTGAGLTFVKKIVERHGGKIWPESTYGEGTTFYFTLDKGVVA
ncbi:Phytochrome-like protein cph1 [Stieleria neptunia]|uniref:histidine kinase n=1 Tax=Stieleria neptunia TaxID=2527979 RepID=A0A518HLW7_9BACT|nr:ATP-binding protein [Stieleria neptunia]QDV41843.1 Phytochrome-like protein cph1 [Stieleria neptunia]